MDYEACLSAARHAALAAGSYLVERQGTASRLVDPKKDFVADVDRGSHNIIFPILQRSCPGIAFLGEEGESQQVPDGPFWCVDEVDGTIGYFRGSYDYAVSIALIEDGEVKVGLIYQPALGRLYWAVLDDASRQDRIGFDDRLLSTELIRVQIDDDLSSSQIFWGWGKNTPNDAGHRRVMRIIDRMRHISLYPNATSSAAISAVAVAWGRCGAYVAPKDEPWDVAAASIIIQNAGGVVTDFQGNPWTFWSSEFLAASPRMHPVILEAIRDL